MIELKDEIHQGFEGLAVNADEIGAL